MKVLLGRALLLGCCLLASPSAFAQSYPNRTVTIVVTSAAGALTDVLTRAGRGGDDHGDVAAGVGLRECVRACQQAAAEQQRAAEQSFHCFPHLCRFAEA